MEILLKRNNRSGSSLPATASAGEPVWYKDRLYVGSVGTSAGGVSTTGKPIEVGATIYDNKIVSLSSNTYTFVPDSSREYIVLIPSASHRDITINIDIRDADDNRFCNSNEHYILVHAVNGESSVTFSVTGTCPYKFLPQEAIVVPANAAVEFSVKTFIPDAAYMSGNGYVIVTNSAEIQPQ